MKRKWYACVLICLILIYLSVTAAASTKSAKDARLESLWDEAQAEGILALRGDIVNWINSALQSENKEKSYSDGNHILLTEEDVDFHNMYKVHRFVPDEWEKPLSQDAMQEMMQKSDSAWVSDSVWVYEHTSGDVIVDLYISVAKPLNEELAYRTDEAGNRLLSDEEIQMLKNRAGKWRINSAAVGPKEHGFGNLLRNAMAEVKTEETVYFVSFPYLMTHGVVSLSEKNARFHVLDKVETQNTGETVVRTYGQKQITSIMHTVLEELKSRPTHNKDGNILYYGVGMPEPSSLPLPEKEITSPYVALGVMTGVVLLLCGFAYIKKAAARKE
jgi:hypothetical protein